MAERLTLGEPPFIKGNHTSNIFQKVTTSMWLQLRLILLSFFHTPGIIWIPSFWYRKLWISIFSLWPGHTSGFLCQLCTEVKIVLPPRDSSCDAFIEKQSHPLCLCSVKLNRRDWLLATVRATVKRISKHLPTTAATSNSLCLRKHFFLVYNICKAEYLQSWIFANM